MIGPSDFFKQVLSVEQKWFKLHLVHLVDGEIDRRDSLLTNSIQTYGR